MQTGSKLIIALISFLISGTSCTKELPERPNILFITTDYHAWEDVPEITPVINMPALDRLYKEGLVFENHYCTAPVCMPSRYTIITGTYPHTHGAWDNTGKWIPEDSPLLMKSLSDAGYKTIGIGKMHFKPWERMAGFDKRIIADAQGNWAGDTLKKDDYYTYLKSVGETRFSYLKYQDSTDIFGVYPWPLNDTLDIDYFVGNETVKYIEEGDLTDDPWFMWVSFNGPHNPWDPPEELMDYYLEKDLPEARYLEGELDTKPYAHTITRYNYTRKVVDKIDQFPENRDSYIKKIRAGHYGGLTWIDIQMQRILDKLEEKGKLNNTIVIFSADHGAHLGDHDQIHKGTHYERSSHVPFVIWWPEVLKPKRVKGFTSHVDLFPTLIELAGGTLPEGLEGESLYPVLEGRKEAADRAVIEIIGNTAVVTKDYKLGIYRQFKEADFYDRNLDPNEFKNVIDQPEYKNIVDELSNYLYSIDPTLKKDYKKAPEVEPLATKVELSMGQTISGNKLPYLGGESFNIILDIKTDNLSDGPIITHYEGQHGFAFYMERGVLKLGFRKWNEDQIITAGKIDPGNHILDCSIDKTGYLIVNSDGVEISSGQTIWPKPVQAGRKEYLKGNINAGKSGPARAVSIGDYGPGSTFTGTINKVILELYSE